MHQPLNASKRQYTPLVLGLCDSLGIISLKQYSNVLKQRCYPATKP